MRSGEARGVPPPHPRAADRSTGRKVLASLGLVTAWAALPGLGTFGSFSDGSTPWDAVIAGGRPSLAVTEGLADAAAEGTVPLTVAGLLPGDGVLRTIDLRNDGDVPLSAVTMRSVAAMPGQLVDGLQVAVTACSVPWDADGGCAGSRRVLVPAGPVVREAALPDPASLVPGRTDHLAVSVTLPRTAGDQFAGLRGAVELRFTAVQRGGAAR